MCTNCIPDCIFALILVQEKNYVESKKCYISFRNAYFRDGNGSDFEILVYWIHSCIHRSYYICDRRYFKSDIRFKIIQISLC